MTNHGEKLPNLTTDEVTARLADESNATAIKRLVAAREYLDGTSPAEIAEKFGWPEQTIYSWFDRFEARGLDDALEDESPPGRPATLSDEQFEQFESAVRKPPEAAGLDAPAWTSALARDYLRREFDHEFSRRHVRRLMRDANRS